MAVFGVRFFRQYRIIQVCGLRSKILRQVVQKIEVRLTPCRDFFGHTDGIIFKQGVRHELCGVAFIFCSTKTPINSLFISVFGFPIIPYQE